MKELQKINAYIDALYGTTDPIVEGVLSSIKENGLPAISVSPSTSKLLTLLVAISGASRVVEIGALGGYSGIALAKGLSDTGHLLSLELEQNYADLAKKNVTKAGYGTKVSYIVGPALTSLAQLEQQGQQFDFFFIDADKENYKAYAEACLALASPHALIVADNTLASGNVVGLGEKKRAFADHIQAFNKWVAQEPRVESILVPIGDGLTIARVK